tara:strand:- start:144 stop:335 length:192 start_codon:yes stop_codon:yes gene_type:complete
LGFERGGVGSRHVFENYFGCNGSFFRGDYSFFMEEKPAMMWFLPTVFAVYAYGGNELFDKFKK